MARENKSKYALLGMLSIKPMSGYQIKQNLEKSLHSFWNESYGQIYPMLKQLVAEGLAEVQAEERQEKSAAPFYVYALTEQGRRVLREWLVRPIEPEQMRSELMLKLIFGHQVPVVENMRLVRQWQEITLQRLAVLRSLEAAVLEMEALQPHDSFHLQAPFSLITLRCGIHISQAYLVWCEETLAQLEALAAEKGESS